MNLGKSRIFLFACLSFIAGVFLGRYANFAVMAIAAIVFVMVLTIFWNNRPARLIGFLGLLLILGSWRWQGSQAVGGEHFVGQLFGQAATFTGVIAKDPDVRADRVNLTVQPDGWRGLVLLTVGKYPEYKYGDRLQITGKMEEPFATPEFSYKNYLSRYETYASVRYPKLLFLGSGYGNRLTGWLLALKHKFSEVLSQSLPEPHNALALGLLLGLKRSLPEDLKQALILAGVSHIIVISGYNISILTRNLLKTRAWWGKRIAFWLSLFTVLGFVVITGAEASVVRAAVMGMLVVLALNLGRLYQSLNALVFVGAVMILQNPKILSFDVGFQLSFLATFGLIFLGPLLENWVRFLPDILGFRTNLASTLSAQLMTLPLLIFYFERISLVAPIVNVLILWVIPYAMFFVFLTGLLALAFFPLGQLFAVIPWLFLEFLVRVVEWFARLPLAAVSATIHWSVVVAYYLALMGGLWVWKRRLPAVGVQKV